jgi:hypothetical protein
MIIVGLVIGRNEGAQNQDAPRWGQ